MKTKLTILTLLPLLAALAHADPVTLEWDPNPEPDIAEYRVYVGTQAGSYGPAKVVKITPTETKTELALDLPKDVPHFAVVTAVNTIGLESLPSNELVFRLGTTPPSKPGNLRIKIDLQATLQISRDLEQWVDRGSVNSDQLFFRLTTATPGAEAGAGNPAPK